MFKDVGGKIKTYAKVLFAIEVIADIIFGIIIISQYGTDNILIGLALIIIAPFVELVGCWFLYGFGELIEKTAQIEKNTSAKGNSVSFSKYEKNSNNIVGRFLGQNEVQENIDVQKSDAQAKIEDIKRKKKLLEEIYNKGIITDDGVYQNRLNYLNEEEEKWKREV